MQNKKFLYEDMSTWKNDVESEFIKQGSKVKAKIEDEMNMPFDPKNWQSNYDVKDADLNKGFTNQTLPTDFFNDTATTEIYTNPNTLSLHDALRSQPKRDKAEPGKDYYTTVPGDTMYTISQRYGIKLKKLYEMNRMTDGTEPDAGKKIWLRNIKPVD
jgi:LysM repeat protein